MNALIILRVAAVEVADPVVLDQLPAFELRIIQDLAEIIVEALKRFTAGEDGEFGVLAQHVEGALIDWVDNFPLSIVEPRDDLSMATQLQAGGDESGLDFGVHFAAIERGGGGDW